MKKLIALLILLAVGIVHAGIDYASLTDVATTYTNSTGIFEISGTGLVTTVVYDDGTPQLPVSPTDLDLTTNYVSGMDFAGGSFLLTSADGTLLQGTVDGMTFGDQFGMLVGVGTATVTGSGHELAGFPIGPAEIISITFELDPAFEGFNQDYTGLSKINLGVPEPATLALLALGGLLIKKRS